MASRASRRQSTKSIRRTNVQNATRSTVARARRGDFSGRISNKAPAKKKAR